MSTVLSSSATAADQAQTRRRRALPAANLRLYALGVVALTGALIGWRRAEWPYSDSDVLWGTRAGRDLLRSWSIPRTDSYSWTAHGTSWYPNSWAWNAVLAGAYRVGGLTGIAVLGIVMTATVGIGLALAGRAIGAKPAWTSLVLLVVGAVFGVFFYARAQIVDYVMIFVLPPLLKRAIAADRRSYWRSVLLITLVQAAWMNLHSGALLGPVLLLAAAIGTALSARHMRARAIARGLGAVTFSAIACLTTPYGISGITHAEAVRSASVGLISEWQPAGVGNAAQRFGLIALALGLLAGILALRARRLATVGMLAVLAAATASAIRFAPMLALLAMPEFAVVAGRIRVRDAFLRRAGALCLVIFAVACVFGLDRFAKPGDRYYDPSLVSALPPGCRLLNDDDIGGEVILARPDVLVFIDSRNDLYGRAAELRSLRQLGDPAVGLAFIRDARVNCVLIPTAAPLTRALRTEPGWRVGGMDGYRTMLLRNGTG